MEMPMHYSTKLYVINIFSKVYKSEANNPP